MKQITSLDAQLPPTGQAPVDFVHGDTCAPISKAWTKHFLKIIGGDAPSSHSSNSGLCTDPLESNEFSTSVHDLIRNWNSYSIRDLYLVASFKNEHKDFLS